MLLCALALHSCQQTPLNVVGDEPTEESPQTPQLLSTQPKQSTNATKEQEPCCIVLTSSSDSSPDTKHTDSESLGRDATAQSIANAPQGSTMAAANADAIAADANREVSRKRPATTQVGKHNEKLPATKHAEKETPSRSHEAWFTAFANATEQIEEDSEDEEAWEKMEKLLDEDGKNNFLTASITFPNDSNPAAEYEYTPLHYAAAKGLLALVKELVKQRNVAVDITTQDNKSTPLHLAASRGHLHVVQFLVDQGADPKLLDSDEGSALQYAAAGRRGERNRDVIEYLVEKGADLLRPAKNGFSPLSAAVCAGNIPVVEYWEDKYSNNQAPEVDTLTEKALKIARYRAKRIPQEREIQSLISQTLEGLLASRKNTMIDSTAQHNLQALPNT
jgi:Ankyrin repeats (3 copies)